VVNQKSKIKNQKSLRSPPVKDRGSIKNQKSKTLSPTSPKSFRGRQGSMGGQSKIFGGQSKIKNQKSKIKNPLDSPPSEGSGVNLKSQIKNLVADIPQIMSRTPGQDRSSIENRKSKIVRSLVNLKSKI